MEAVTCSPADPATRALLAEYFAERVAGFERGLGYRVAEPDPVAFTPPTGLFLRIEETDLALGCGGVRTIAPDEHGVRMEVKHLFVRPAARGRGAGRLLLAAIEDRARSVGASTLVLDTNRALTAAAALYRSAGFIPTPAYNDNPNATDWYVKGLR